MLFFYRLAMLPRRLRAVPVPEEHVTKTKGQGMRRRRRLRVWADAGIQGGLCLRVTLYWLACMAAVALMLACRMAIELPAYSSKQWLWLVVTEYGPPLTASLLVLPLALLDGLVFSNRFAGPLRRLIRATKQATAGETVSPVILRRKDSRTCQELASEFNRLLARLQALEADQDTKQSASGSNGDCSPPIENELQPAALA